MPQKGRDTASGPLASLPSIAGIAKLRLTLLSTWQTVVTVSAFCLPNRAESFSNAIEAFSFIIAGIDSLLWQPAYKNAIPFWTLLQLLPHKASDLSQGICHWILFPVIVDIAECDLALFDARRTEDSMTNHWPPRRRRGLANTMQHRSRGEWNISRTLAIWCGPCASQYGIQGHLYCSSPRFSLPILHYNVVIYRHLGLADHLFSTNITYRCGERFSLARSASCFTQVFT
jgi:hypothetical protein